MSKIFSVEITYEALADMVRSPELVQHIVTAAKQDLEMQIMSYVENRLKPEQKITVGSHSATVPQYVIDDLKEIHGIDAIAEITWALEKEEEFKKEYLKTVNGGTN